jgi:hypothetical protein
MYQIKIFNHAHSIFGSVTLIQVFQPCAWITAAFFGTIIQIAFGQFFTVADDTSYAA